MPNWCNNVVLLQHKEADCIDRLALAAQNGRMLAELCPFPAVAADSLHWRFRRWGTKWEPADIVIKRVSETAVRLVFCSAWTPPVAWYVEAEKLGFRVYAVYLEIGVGFCGKFANGECRDFDVYDPDVPADIEAAFEDFFDDLENSGADR